MLTTALFQQIHDSIADGDWCTTDKALTLASIVIATRPKVVVEIGVWTGASLIPMALAAKSLGSWIDCMTQRSSRCKVVAIDPWDPAASVEGQIEVNAKWWGSAPHEWALGELVQKLERYELKEIVEIVRMRSDVAPPPANIGLLHVDGNHGDQAVADVMRFAPNVRGGGIVVLDDFNWDGGAVKRAGQTLEDIGFRALYEIDQKSFAHVYQRGGMR